MLRSPPNEQARAGQIARGAIALARELCTKVIDGQHLDKTIEEYIKDEGGTPALKGYRPAFAFKPYEWTICLALDNDVVHCVPHKLVGPDHLITIDLVVEYQGWYADTARTFTISSNKEKQIFAKNSIAIFESALEMIMPEQAINLYSVMVANGAELYGYSVVNEYCGHGIGKHIHDTPQIFNKPSPSQKIFQVGQAYAVEPVLANQKNYELYHHPYDGFSIRANCLCSHNEDTVFISNYGVINLTNGSDVL